MSNGLTKKQLSFCHEYVIDKNATQAAIRAGYSKKTAKQIGEQNLSKLDIRKKLDELLEEQQKETGITAKRILAEIAGVAFAELDEDKITWKHKIHALEMLCKRFGLDKPDDDEEKRNVSINIDFG